MKILSTTITDTEAKVMQAYIDGAEYSLRAMRPNRTVTEHSIHEEAQLYVDRLLPVTKGE